MTRNLIYVFLVVAAVFLGGAFFFSRCNTDFFTEEDRIGKGVSYPSAYTGFVERWNKETAGYFVAEKDKLLQTTELLEQSIQISPDSKKVFLETKRDLVLKELEELDVILSDGPAILELAESELPVNLEWENGLDEPDIGDENALKGGGIRLWNPSPFPSTLRPFGPGSKNFFNYSLYDNVDMRLVDIHPRTGGIIPGVAKEWAVAENGRTVYYRLHPEARYSDGLEVKARDYLLNICLRVSSFAEDPYYRQLYRSRYSAIRTYGDKIIAITIPGVKPFAEYIAADYHYPANPVFYADFDASYVNKYQWKHAPTTGGYTIGTEDIVRGEKITLRRVRDWWAGGLKYYRNSCNVDAVTHCFITDETKALELFKIGEIDAVCIHKPEIWNDKLEIEPVFNGYIEKVSLLTEFPKAPYGLFINAAVKPMNDIDIRKGFHHSMNMDAVLERIFHGDLPRLGSYSSGYGELSNHDIKAREFSPAKAREYFSRAGYDRAGKDGVLQNEKGERLEVELSFVEMSVLMQNMCSLLKQYALQCGLDLKLDVLESSVCSRKVFENRHQVTFWAWPLSYPLPRLYQMFHSSQVFDEQGRLIPYTDNIVNIADHELDRCLMEERRAETREQYKEATHKVQQRIHDLAVWVPGWEEAYARMAFWRWVRWPDSQNTKFCYPVVYDPLESHLYWIDHSIKEETLAGKRKGISFAGSDITVDVSTE